MLKNNLRSCLLRLPRAIAYQPWVQHPLTRGRDIDDPATTMIRRQVIQQKPFLRQIYRDWYAALATALPSHGGAVLELGSGAGFLSEYVPGLITSEVFFCEFVQVVLDGCALPFADQSLRGIVMTNVLHHIPRPQAFLAEAARCLKDHGVLAMIEPWVSRWSRFIYGRLHHEPFAPDAKPDETCCGGPLSGGNVALPWILFQRDRGSFEREFSQWRIETIRPLMPFRYLLSGGISGPSLVPGWSTGFWRTIERATEAIMRDVAMFALIVLRRTV